MLKTWHEVSGAGETRGKVPRRWYGVWGVGLVPGRPSIWVLELVLLYPTTVLRSRKQGEGWGTKNRARDSSTVSRLRTTDHFYCMQMFTSFFKVTCSGVISLENQPAVERWSERRWACVRHFHSWLPDDMHLHGEAGDWALTVAGWWLARPHNMWGKFQPNCLFSKISSYSFDSSSFSSQPLYLPGSFHSVRHSIEVFYHLPMEAWSPYSKMCPITKSKFPYKISKQGNVPFPHQLDLDSWSQVRNSLDIQLGFRIHAISKFITVEWMKNIFFFLFHSTLDDERRN